MDSHQSKIYTAILITTLIIGTILISFIITLLRQQRRNAALYQSKILAEITTLENERTRVAGDLHDELGPLLSAIKFKLSSIDITNAADIIQMQESSDYLDSIIIRLREISWDLMPSSLLYKGVAVAITEFIDKIPPSTGLKIKFYYRDLPELNKLKAINIYRIVQEITHNTLKHANASLLDIKLEQDERLLRLSASDNGKGFDYSFEKKENTGLGLRNLLNRAETLGANFFIDSGPGKGTQYTIEIPLN